MTRILLYLPVLHAGYQDLFDRHPDAGILLLGTGFQDDFPVLRKDIRALPPAVAAGYLGARARVVEPGDLPDALTGQPVIMPDEEITHALAARYALTDVTFERTFLRWDRGWSQPRRPVGYDGTVASDALSQRLIGEVTEAARHSSDWWRQVGAAVVRDGTVLDVAYNRHQPTEYAPYLHGDPRNDFSRGVRTDLSTATHAEAALVGRAARDGTALAGADLYVSTFPCPACARLIAESGIRRCFFAGPYAVLDGEDILRAAAVELIWVTPAP